MINIYNYDNYKKYINDWVKNQPSKGRGQYTKLAQSAGISSVLISQIFKGGRNLSIDQAHLIGEHLEHTENQQDFFLLMVLKDRAGNYKLRNRLQNQISQKRKENKNLKKILDTDRALTDEEKAIFYSDWTYSAVRLACGLKRINTITAISKELGLDESVISKILEFLLDHQLVVLKNNKLRLGPNKIHLEKESPYINARQKAWRIKSMQAMDKKQEEDFFFSANMSIDETLRDEFNHELNSLIKKFSKRTTESIPENIYCLNIDLFKV